MKNVNYTILSILLAAVLWVVDSTIHRLFFDDDEFEFLPTDINELGMRISIIVLVVCFGLYADYQTKKILKTEREKRIVFHATVSASQHILNNLLNNMQYFKLKIDDSSDFDKETSELFQQSIADAEELVKKLSSVEELTEDKIKDSVYPANSK